LTYGIGGGGKTMISKLLENIESGKKNAKNGIESENPYQEKIRQNLLQNMKEIKI
jgi:hypothetical protein